MDVNLLCWSFCKMYIYQIITLYTLDLYNVTGQLNLS